MTRYIDAEKLAQKVLELEDQLTPRKTFEAEIQYRFLLNVITPMIASTPTEDVAPVVHASWVGTEADGYADGYPVYDVFECSNCGIEHYGEEDTLTDYCPHCGAKMDEEENE